MGTRIELLKRYLTEDPSDSFLRYALALEFIALKDNQTAASEFENLLNDNPEYLPGYYMAGKTYEALGKFDKAKVWYLKGIELARKRNDNHTLSELNAALDGMDDTP